jgi:hypothetical protein
MPGGGTTVYSDNFETATGWTTNPTERTPPTGQWGGTICRHHPGGVSPASLHHQRR